MLFNSFLHIYLFFSFIFEIILVIHKSNCWQQTFLNSEIILNFLLLFNICLSYKRRSCQLKIIILNRNFSRKYLLVFTITLIIMIKNLKLFLILDTFFLILLNQNDFAVERNIIQRKKLLSIKIRKHFGKYFLASWSQIAELLKYFVKCEFIKFNLFLLHWNILKKTNLRKGIQSYSYIKIIFH